MKYCNQCGNPLEDQARFCSQCGAKTEQFRPTETARRRGNPNTETKRSRYAAFLRRYFTVIDTSGKYAEEDRKQNRSTALLSYLHILVLVPLLSMRESKYTQYHAKLGLNLLFYQLLAEIGGGILVKVLGWIPVLGWILNLAVILLNLALWGIAVFGIVSASRGYARELYHGIPFKIFH